MPPETIPIDEVVTELRFTQKLELEKLAQDPKCHVGTLRITSSPKPLGLGMCSTANEATRILGPILPTRHAPPRTVRPAKKRRSPKPATKPFIPKAKPIPTSASLDMQEGRELLAWLKKWNRHLLKGPGSKRKEKQFRQRKRLLHDCYPQLWPQWLKIQRKQRKAVLGV